MSIPESPRMEEFVQLSSLKSCNSAAADPRLELAPVEFCLGKSGLYGGWGYDQLPLSPSNGLLSLGSPSGDSTLSKLLSLGRLFNAGGRSVSWCTPSSTSTSSSSSSSSISSLSSSSFSEQYVLGWSINPTLFAGGIFSPLPPLVFSIPGVELSLSPGLPHDLSIPGAGGLLSQLLVPPLSIPVVGGLMDGGSISTGTVHDKSVPPGGGSCPLPSVMPVCMGGVVQPPKETLPIVASSGVRDDWSRCRMVFTSALRQSTSWLSVVTRWSNRSITDLVCSNSWRNSVGLCSISSDWALPRDPTTKPKIHLTHVDSLWSLYHYITMILLGPFD